MAFILYGTLPLTAAVAVLCAANIVCAVRACRRAGAGEAVRLCRLETVWKLLAVPYFVLNLLAWTAVGSAFLVVPGLQVFLLGLPLAALATYVPLLTSSAYTVGAIIAARKAGVLVKNDISFASCFSLWTPLTLFDCFSICGERPAEEYKICKRCG